MAWDMGLRGVRGWGDTFQENIQEIKERDNKK
jgi:hypothetical protein